MVVASEPLTRPADGTTLNTSYDPLPCGCLGKLYVTYAQWVT